MGNIFSYDSKLIAALTILADAIFANLLYVLLCLPVFTIGAARAALYTVAEQWAQKESAGAKAFLAAFFRNFRQATPPWLVMLGGGFLLVLDYLLLFLEKIPGAMAFLLLLIPLTIAWALTLSQLFLLIARLACTFRQALINALLFALAHPLQSVIHLLLAIAPWVILFSAPDRFMEYSPLWFLGYFSVEAFISVSFSRRAFARLAQRAEKQDEA